MDRQKEKNSGHLCYGKTMEHGMEDMEPPQTGLAMGGGVEKRGKAKKKVQQNAGIHDASRIG